VAAPGAAADPAGGACCWRGYGAWARAGRQRIQYDLYYITHWTPWLDIRILWLTIWQGFVNRNAY
jgi:putative colanic acid biosynthesis UDP-glucose lipid carrier transferase